MPPSQEEHEQWLLDREISDARSSFRNAAARYFEEPSQPWRFDELREKFIALDKLETGRA